MNENFNTATMMAFLNRLEQLKLLPLWRYVVENNPSANAPYHNNHHMLHMAWLADLLYQSETQQHGEVCPIHLLVAALFHDYDHTAGVSPDSVNIEQAIDGWAAAYQKFQPANINPELVSELIRSTEYPYPTPALTLEAKCLRDADLLYTTVMGNPYIVLRDLKAEMEVLLGRTITEVEMSEGYKEFIRKAELHSDLAKSIRLQCFPVFTLSLALRCSDGQVSPISPAHAEEWLKG
jgi:5'-deoxynucleotidase YfbR-like HD superfamily hydrolase